MNERIINKFIFRNWDILNLDDIEKSLRLDIKEIVKKAHDMGLPKKKHIPESLMWRNGFAVIRRNWDILPIEEIAAILRKSREEVIDHAKYIQHAIEEKPEPFADEFWDRPDIIKKYTGYYKYENSFEFIEDLNERGSKIKSIGNRSQKYNPFMVFAYHGVFYNGLLHALDFYTEDYLALISSYGCNAIWINDYLRKLVKLKYFPEFGKDSCERIRNLNKLVERAKKYNIDVYLYQNEPRGMPEEFFKKHPDIKGEKGINPVKYYSMCTSHPLVKKFLVDSYYQIFSLCKGLKGVFVITASEDVTNCYSHRHKSIVSCPRCKKREPYEVVSEVLALINKGAKKANKNASVIAWSWAWGGSQDRKEEERIEIEPDPQYKLITSLPKDIGVLTDFERKGKKRIAGREYLIDEYSLSYTGPSKEFKDHNRICKTQGRNHYAKIQVGTTCECFAVPYLPIPYKLYKKFAEIKKYKIKGMVASWTFGGYPGLMLELAKYLTTDNNFSIEEILLKIAKEDYENPDMIKAWKIFSEAIEDYPFSNNVVYFSPINFGPFFPIYYPRKNRKNSIYYLGDDYKHWTEPFGPELFITQFEKLKRQWEKGVRVLKSIRNKNNEIKAEFNVATAFLCHVNSALNITKFYVEEEKLGNKTEVDKRKILNNMLKLIRSEQKNVTECLKIAGIDSRIGYQPEVQYCYRQIDLIEKIIKCKNIEESIRNQLC